jgi:3-hydroxyisobutyrate dehydrogenase-like beta-hydroxyacid dehydrogenase
MQVAFLGLGNMGFPMARHLVEAGHPLTVYNRTPGRADALPPSVRRGRSPRDAVSDADIVVTMLADDRAVTHVAFGQTSGFLSGMAPGSLHVSMSTISVALSRRLSEAHAEAGQLYVAAPVFGRPEAAETAKLWIVAGGAEADVNRCRPLFDAMGQGVFVVGNDATAANTVKLAGNFMIASMLETMGETFALARRAGVRPQQFLEVVNAALFQSPLYASYGMRIAEERFDPPGFRLKLGLKDVRLALEAAIAENVPLPLAGVLCDRFMMAIARGEGDLDWSAVARMSAWAAGLE